MFADEAGNFDFTDQSGASRYFILTTVTCQNCDSDAGILALRRYLAWNGHDLSTGLHAANDPWPVRNAAFDLIRELDLRVDSTVLEKRKAMPHIRADSARFYQAAWWLHFRYVAPRIASKHDELFVIAASLKTASKRTAFSGAVNQVVRQVSPVEYRTAFWPSIAEPWLWVADYCCWAIQRKWERGDSTFYGRIKDRIYSEFNAFQVGKTYYY